MPVMIASDGSRLIVKNLPLTLDNRTLRIIFTENASKLGLQITDCQLLHKDPKLLNKYKSSTDKKHKVFENGKVSKGVCFIGFINKNSAKKFKEYYNGTYVRSCKITIDFAKPPNEPNKSNDSLNNSSIKSSRKAGVSSVRIRKIFNEESCDEVIQTNLDPAPLDDHVEDAYVQRPFNRVVIFNLPYNISEDELRQLVKNFGPIAQIHIPINKYTESDNTKVLNLTRGFAYIKFLFDVDAGRFLQEKDRTIFCGRLINILPAKDDNNNNNTNVIVNDELNSKKKNKGYKAELKERLRQDADNHDIWNTLYIDINTAIQAMSDELGISREQLLGLSDKHSIAVTAASSETAIIAKLKSWLNQEGIDIECFQQSQANSANGVSNGTKSRSTDTIIVKNLPFNTQEDELRDLFAKRGQLIRFSLSPYRNMSIVQYMNAEDAKRAFSSLAYKNYLGMPIYLEWAPINLFKDNAPTINKLDFSNDDDESTNSNQGLYEENDGLYDDVTNEFHASIYIKNLNFITTSERLNQLMSSCDGLITCKVITRYDAAKDKTLSMGFGFAEFNSLEAAQNAIKLQSGKLLDGHLLEFSLADRNSVKKSATKRKISKEKNGISKATNKLLVKNLAFQATKSEVRKLFSLYGNVKTVRIPKNISNNNRGFAFVEFESKSDAINALEALQHTHLYGRHLVLDFAKPTQFDNNEQDMNLDHNSSNNYDVGV